MSNLTKREFAALVLRKLDGGMHTTQSKYDEREIFLYLDGAISEAITPEVKAKNIDSSWISPFYAQEKWDSKRKEAYIDLPAPIINEIGLVQISLVEDQSNPYIISDNTQGSYMNNLEAGTITSTYECYLEGNKKIFVKKNKTQLNEVLLKLIVSSSGYGDDEPIAYPSDKQNYIIEATYKLAITQFQEKMTNNQNPDTK